MRTIEYTGAFRRDFKREKAGRHRRKLDALVAAATASLAADRPMPPAYCDHPLSGDWNDHRDCHLRPDLLLIYRKPDKATLQLVRLGSHHELFG
jgi:mRNA interferase YafQ